MEIYITKDDFFATKKWFIETDDGVKWNTVGFKTRKAAIAATEAALAMRGCAQFQSVGKKDEK